jgi:AAA family ATP:ADP antiporter
MAKKSFQNILSRVFDVRPEETSSSILLFCYFFLITSSAYIIKPVKLSLFLDQLSFDKLPYAYLLTAVFMGFFVGLNTKLLRVMERHIYISLCLGFFIVNLLLFWFFFRMEWKWLSMVYWLWSEIFMVTTVTQFWILVNDIYNLRQAKRLVGFLVSGGLLGGICGALLSSLLAGVLRTENLLLVCPALLVLCLVIVLSVKNFRKEEVIEKTKKEKEQKKPKVGYLDSFNLVRKNRHLILLSGIMIAAIVVTTLIDFQFNMIAADHFSVKDERTVFFGYFFAALLVFSFLLHTFSTSRILKNFGIRTALLVAPVLLLLGSASVFLIGAIGVMIYWVVPLKGADKSLAHSLNQSVRELLYIPIPPDIKYRAKVFIDMFVNKLARGIGALLILLAFSVFQMSRDNSAQIVRYMSILVIVFTMIWIILDLLITREYVNIVKKSLKIKWQDADRLIGEKIDVDMTKLVFDTLESKNRSSVLYAMNLFDLVKKEMLSPELKKIISQKSDEIMASSLDSLFELDGEVLIPEMEDTFDEESLDVQVKEIMSLDVYQELMKKQIDKIISQEGREAEVSRMEAAKVMGMMEPSPSLIRSLNRLIRNDSPEVVSYAVESAEKLKRREFVPFIIHHLSNPYVERVAHKALVTYGDKIIGTLKDYLGDSDEAMKLRKAIPDILADIGTQRAAELLALEMGKDNKDVELEIISAMYKIKSKKPQINFPEKIISAGILVKIKESYVILNEIYELMSDKKKQFLAKDLENNLAQTLRRIFELLSLIYPHEDMIKAYQNICDGTKKALDYSIEFLDNTVKKDIMEFLLPLVEDIPLEDKVRRSRKILKSLEKTKLS